MATSYPRDCNKPTTDSLKSASSSTETQQKVSKLAEITAKTFFEFVLQSRKDQGSEAPQLNFSEILEFADKFNRVFVDTLTIKWNENQVGRSPDYSQHCDSAEEDEVFENSLYQPCPDAPCNQYEPVYENSMNDDAQSADYDSVRDSDDIHDNTPNLGDVTPTPPTESHYSAMLDCDSGTSSNDRLYDSPPGNNLEEQLLSQFQAKGFKIPFDQTDSRNIEPSKTNGGDTKEHETTNSINAFENNQQISDIEKRMKASMQLNFKSSNDETAAQQQNQQAKNRPKLKSAIKDFSSEASEFLRSKKNGGDVSKSTKSNDQNQGQPKSAPVVVKKESVLEVRIHKADASPSSWQPCRLVLLKTHGGFMLNVHTPPDSDKIYSSIFCPLIYEIGEATESQFGKTADRVLVIKAQDNVSVTLRARNYEDKHDWICVLRENTDAKSTKRVIYTDSQDLSPMTPTQDMYDGNGQRHVNVTTGAVYSYESGSPNSSRRGSTASLSSSYSRDSLDRNQYVTAHQANFGSSESFERQKSMPNPPTYIYQDGAVYARQNSHPGKAVSQVNVSEKESVPSNSGHVPRIASCSDFMNTPPPVSANRGNSVYGSRVSALEQLRTFPWFHGKLPRETASKMVLAQSNPAAGHGIYLVRQSETNENEFTLTFNYEGKAKHLRINVDAQTGICQLQNLQFKSLRHLIDTYTKEKLPIDVKGSSDITLKSYIANFGSASGGGAGNGGAILNSQLQPHKRNKSVDFNIERNTELGPKRPGMGGGGPGVNHYVSAGYNPQRPAPVGGPSKVSNSQGVYYASHK